MKKELLFSSLLPGRYKIILCLNLAITMMLIFSLNISASVSGDIARADDPPQQMITGTITDASTGEALPGVSVVVKGTSFGVSSDIQGTILLIRQIPMLCYRFHLLGIKLRKYLYQVG